MLKHCGPLSLRCQSKHLLTVTSISRMDWHYPVTLRTCRNCSGNSKYYFILWGKFILSCSSDAIVTSYHTVPSWVDTWKIRQREKTRIRLRWTHKGELLVLVVFFAFRTCMDTVHSLRGLFRFWNEVSRDCPDTFSSTPPCVALFHVIISVGSFGLFVGTNSMPQLWHGMGWNPISLKSPSVEDSFCLVKSLYALVIVICATDKFAISSQLSKYD